MGEFELNSPGQVDRVEYLNKGDDRRDDLNLFFSGDARKDHQC